ncbi:MAG TPA: hypothetical protein VN950_19075 [Terriglobales bacterium]|nr:hypothetical protein [Terriglobales bacterium]
MPWLRTQTEFEMEDEDVILPSESFAMVSDPRNGQPGAAIPAKFQVTVRRVQHPAMDRMSQAEAHHKNRADRCQPGTSLGSSEIIPARIDAVSRQ